MLYASTSSLSGRLSTPRSTGTSTPSSASTANPVGPAALGALASNPAVRLRELDLGDNTERYVTIGPAGWRLVDPDHEHTTGPLFRRTRLTAPLPPPDPHANLTHLELLKRHANVTPDDWPLLIAWLVATLLTDRPCPGVLLTGEQGTAKTTTTVALAACYAHAGKRVLVIDVDPQANATSGLGIAQEENSSMYPCLLGSADARSVIRSTRLSNLSIIRSHQGCSDQLVRVAQDA